MTKKWSVLRQSVLGAPPWRKRRPNRPRRPWLVSLVISTRLSSPVTTVVFAGQLAQLTPTSRQAKLSAIARALGLALPVPLPISADREPLRNDHSRVGTVLCARSVSIISDYLSLTGIKNHPVWSGMFTHPTSPYATAEPVPALPSIGCIVRTDHGCL